MQEKVKQNTPRSLTDAECKVVEVTYSFMLKLSESGVTPEQVSHEGYKFAVAALQGDVETCTTMDTAAIITRKAALAAQVHPKQLQRAMEMSGRR